MTLLLQVRTIAYLCFTRTYRTAAQSNRTYGPSPSDIRPVPTVIPDDTLPVVRRGPGRPSKSPDEKKKQRKKIVWTEDMRQKQRELFANSEHPSKRWAKDNPEQYAVVVKKRVERAKAWRSSIVDKGLLDLIRAPQPRMMEPYSNKYPKYRLSLFTDKFFVRFEGTLTKNGKDPPPRETNMLISFSPGVTTHPYAARHQPSHANFHRELHGDPRLNRIGVRISGFHPITREPYAMWLPVGDVALRRALKIYDRIKDQEHLEVLCTEAYNKYVINPNKDDIPTNKVNDPH